MAIISESLFLKFDKLYDDLKNNVINRDEGIKQFKELGNGKLLALQKQIYLQHEITNQSSLKNSEDKYYFIDDNDDVYSLNSKEGWNRFLNNFKWTLFDEIETILKKQYKDFDNERIKWENKYQIKK